MTLYAAITTALDGRTAPIAGRDVAEAAGIAYKAAIDALGRMLDAGTVVRYGRKRASMWALTAAPAGAQPDPLGAVEEAWRTRPAASPPTPPGGRAKPTPGLVSFYRSLPQNFSRHRKSKIFFRLL